MITTSNENNIKRHGVQCEGSFNIKTTGKAFRILSDGLYSDKITAIIRELSCNAYDAHVQAGKADVPFLVQLPNTFEHVFKVKDSGVGLSHDNVINLYTTYFESTKNDSNDFVGCLGLGSKSPFCYISSFNIISNFNGEKRQYNAFINEHDVPTIALMSESETNEENGFEISFNVKSCDYNEFKIKAQKVYKYFKTKPIISGVDNFETEKISYVLKGEKWGLRDDNSSQDYARANAIMGNVCYPISSFISNNESNDNQSNINKLVALPIDIFFDIGELEVAASRENISYNKHSINSINIIFQKLIKEINENVHSAINVCETLWDARITISHLMKDKYRSLKNIIADENFKWGDVTIEGFSNIVNIPIDLYNDIYVTRFSKKDRRCRFSYSTTLTISQEEVKYLYCDNSSMFLWKDIPVNSVKRCKKILNENSNIKYVYLVSARAKEIMGKFENKTEQEKLENKNSFEEFLGTKIKPVSSIEIDKTKYPTVGVNQAKNCSQFLVYDHYKTNISTPSILWEPIKIDLKKDSDTHIYVALDRYCVDFEKSFDYIKRHKNTLMLINEKHNIEIVGVKQKSVVDIKNKSNWISLQEYVRNKLIEYVNKHDISNTISNMEKIRELNKNQIAKELLDIYSKNYTKFDIKNKKSPIGILLFKTKIIKRILKNKFIKNIDEISIEVKKYNIELKPKKMVDLTNAVDDVLNHYPLIKALNYNIKRYEKEIIHYINAVDMSNHV